MARSRRPTYRRNAVPSDFAQLSNPILEKTLPFGVYLSRVAHFLAYEDDREFNERFDRLLDRPRFRSAFNGYASRVEDISKHPLLRSGVSDSRMWSIYRSIFRRDAEKLGYLTRQKKIVERAFLFGQYDTALRVLEDTKTEIGESLWYIRTKALILFYQGQVEEMHRFCEEVKSRSKEYFFIYVVNSVQLIAHSDNAAMHLKKLVINNIIELVEAGQDEPADLLALIFCPSPLISERDCYGAFSRVQAYPIVDQYLMILEIIRLHLANRAISDDVDAASSDIPRFLSELSEVIDDPMLLTLQRERSLKPPISDSGQELLRLYECGKYGEVIQHYFSNLQNFDAPAAYVSIVAKSLAYAGEDNLSRFKSSPLIDYVRDFSSLYRLDFSDSQSEEEIVSRIIKMHGMVDAVHFNCAVYQVHPQRYSPKERQVSAASAILTDSDVPPMTRSIADGDSGNFGVKYGQEMDPSCPEYRSLKRKICQLVNDGAADDEIQVQMEALRVITPLKRDYLELYSEYCVYTDRLHALIDVCSRNIVDDPRTHVCFPMDALIAEIEKEQLVSLQAILVAYVYSRYVSAKKDYVLNETFDEYLLSAGVTRPTELIAGANELTKADVIFFRDICSLEIMDFLSCFNNTDDLRAERIKILDVLNRFGEIDPATRMTEVEEIVGQVIIDAGTQALNGAKIYVNDGALKKKNIALVDSLLTLFRCAKEDDEDKYIILGSIDDEEARAVLSGTKNSVVMRLITGILDSFLFDERYGLDKNLSGEIRHGFFPNLMRSKLEEHKLITEIGDNGKYKKNQYWMDFNSLITDDILSAIDSNLSDFSASFNRVLSEAQEWMKIASAPEQDTRLFRYDITTSDVEEIRTAAETCTDADELSDFLSNWIWGRTQECLTQMRDALNGVFREKVDSLFDELVQRIEETKKRAALVELMSAITHARNGIREDISTVTGWFERSEGNAIADQTLDQALEIAINSFGAVRRAASPIQLECGAEFKQLVVLSKSAKPFVIGLTNLIDNCYRHSGLGLETPVTIRASIDRGTPSIRISNPVTEERALGINASTLLADDGKMRDEASLRLMRVEGDRD
ncbi:hypothetical protein [Cupriavidus sp. D39]|uniref:hypothetical protein n=1 Tax=Cupriavidus sp. D39 TaxID=2997877 RepID=UPI00226D5BF6|nr:hypothetical protein [Cupriavidus sp. D39]MCY0854999.1 hypothetical protein [Cupriavidus sp. D39]